MIYLSYVALSLVAWIACISIAASLAVIPFFFVGLTGRLIEIQSLRKEKKKAAIARARDVEASTEAAVWTESEQSHASLFQSPGEPLRRAS